MVLDFIKAAILGVVEGLTEFLPVSSTAHLLLTSQIIDFTAIQNNLFEIVIQFGAILAICVLYYRKIFNIAFTIKQKSSQKFILNLFLAFLPSAFIGLILHDFIKKVLFSNLVISIALIVGGIIMIIIDKKRGAINKQTSDEQDIIDDGKITNISSKQAILIGFFQSIAIIPGTSRSGATIIGGLMAGLNRKMAAEFSFFLAIPTIFAASIYDLYKNFDSLNIENMQLILVGLITSFFSAILVIKWFIAFVSKNSFVSFGIYRIVIGLIILLSVL
jgi:undecaprenyl-diphosphatase